MQREVARHIFEELNYEVAEALGNEVGSYIKKPYSIAELESAVKEKLEREDLPD